MIFGRIKNEAIVQAYDKTRIDVSKSFVTSGSSAITKLEVQADPLGVFYDVTTLGYLDYVYSGATDTTITLIVTSDSSATVTSPIKIVTAATDNLFSTDDELQLYEGDILSYVRDGRDSFIDKHRAMQSKILDELSASNILKSDGTRFVASDIVDKEDFKKWSLYGVLENIFEELSNQVGDVFDRKREHYKGIKIEVKKRATLSLDFNGNGTVETTEKINTFSNILVRR